MAEHPGKEDVHGEAADAHVDDADPGKYVGSAVDVRKEAHELHGIQLAPGGDCQLTVVKALQGIEKTLFALEHPGVTDKAVYVELTVGYGECVIAKGCHVKRHQRNDKDQKGNKKRKSDICGCAQMLSLRFFYCAFKRRSTFSINNQTGHPFLKAHVPFYRIFRGQKNPGEQGRNDRVPPGNYSLMPVLSQRAEAMLILCN